MSSAASSASNLLRAVPRAGPQLPLSLSRAQRVHQAPLVIYVPGEHFEKPPPAISDEQVAVLLKTLYEQ